MRKVNDARMFAPKLVSSEKAQASLPTACEKSQILSFLDVPL